LLADALQLLQSDMARGFNSAKGLSPFTAFTFGQHSRGAIDELKITLGTDVNGYPNNLTDIVIVFKLASTNRKAMTWMKNL
jgi:hypothetical protein